MFDFEKKESRSKLPLIVSDFDILLFDDEPILFTGKNEKGDYIIGTSIEDDDDRKIQWYFHTVVDEAVYRKFIDRQITYLNILKNSDRIFIIGKAYDNSFVKIYYINFADIPSDYLPLENSYCPELQTN